MSQRTYPAVPEITNPGWLGSFVRKVADYILDSQQPNSQVITTLKQLQADIESVAFSYEYEYEGE
jgi:hypothetical protein